MKKHTDVRDATATPEQITLNPGDHLVIDMNTGQIEPVSEDGEVLYWLSSDVPLMFPLPEGLSEKVVHIQVAWWVRLVSVITHSRELEVAPEQQVREGILTLTLVGTGNRQLTTSGFVAQDGPVIRVVSNTEQPPEWAYSTTLATSKNDEIGHTGSAVLIAKLIAAAHNLQLASEEPVPTEHGRSHEGLRGLHGVGDGMELRWPLEAA